MIEFHASFSTPVVLLTLKTWGGQFSFDERNGFTGDICQQG
jgi:hypothetical protein